MRRLWLVPLIFLTLLVVAMPVLGAYSATFTITESNGTAYTMLPVRVAAPNTWMSTNGFFTSTALDTRVQTLGGLNRPHLVADDKTLTASVVPADSQTNLYFTTGNSALTNMDIIPGYNGYVTVADVPALETGNNFAHEVRGAYVNTSLAGDILRKTDAFWIRSDGNGNIVSAIYNAASTDILRPDGAGAYTNIASQFPAATAHWDKVDEAAADDATTYVYQTTVVQQKDAYTVTAPTIASTTEINSVSVYFRIANLTANWSVYAQPFLRLNGVETTGTEVSRLQAAGWGTYNEALARPGGGSWSVADLADLEVVIGVRADAGTTGAVTQVYVSVQYNPTLASAQSSGEYKLEVYADGVNFTMEVDDVVEDTLVLGGVSVPDNANNWILMSNATPYWNSYQHTVGGTLIAHYQPVTIISGTTLPDREGAAQNGVITWGTNPAGVTVALGGMVSDAQTVVTVTERGTRDILPTTPVSDWFEEPDVSGTLLTNPFRPFVTILSDTTTLTERQAWVWLGIAFVLFVLVLTAKSVRGHHLITGFATGAVVLAMVVMTVFPMWALVFIILAILGGMVAERSPTL